MTGRAFVLCLAAMAASCAYPVGVLYTGTTTPDKTDRVTVRASRAPTRTGEACASGVLGLVAWGDASVATAKKNGGLSEVYTVDSKLKTIIGIYTQGCTIVTGPALAEDDGGAALVDGDGSGEGDGNNPNSKHGRGDANQGDGSPSNGSAQGAQGAGHGGGGPPLPNSGGHGEDHRGTPGPVPTGVAGEITLPTYTQVPYSFLFDARAHENNHRCENFDPNRWSFRLDPRYPYAKPVKDTMPVNQGSFVNACPAADLVATCDYGAANGMVEYFYKGYDDANLQFLKIGCPKWNWVIPHVVARPPASSGPLVLACDHTRTLLGGSCIELRPTDEPVMIQVTRNSCGAGIVPRCPTQGMTGRCDAGKAGIHYFYGSNPAAEGMCIGTHGSWSAPAP